MSQLLADDMSGIQIEPIVTHGSPHPTVMDFNSSAHVIITIHQAHATIE